MGGDLGFSLHGSLLLLAAVYLSAFASIAVAATFSDYFTAFGDAEHVRVSAGGQSFQLVLDRKAAAGFGSQNQYLFGSVSMQIKLIPGDSAGTVLAYYMSSHTSAHDEIDFEFLGNSSGEPYAVQTNIYASGVGGREQRMLLWFDPTEAFHSYSILWNLAQIVFYVDSIPIRVYKNNQNMGVPFLSSQPMNIYSSLWNGDQWATQGGAVKLNWTHEPFITTYQNIQIDACVASSSSSSSISACLANSKWNQAAFHILSNPQKAALQSVRQNYITYDYCSDRKRFSSPPAECSLNTI